MCGSMASGAAEKSQSSCTRIRLYRYQNTTIPQISITRMRRTRATLSAASKRRWGCTGALGFRFWWLSSGLGWRRGVGGQMGAASAHQRSSNSCNIDVGVEGEPDGHASIRSADKSICTPLLADSPHPGTALRREPLRHSCPRGTGPRLRTSADTSPLALPR